MCITINRDEDLCNFIDTYITDNTKHELKYSYSSAGIRSYINLGKFNGLLFLELKVRKINLQLKWNLSEEVFINTFEEFGFTEDGLRDSEGLFLYRPQGYNIGEENSLLEKLINLTFGQCVGNKYGLK